MTLRTLLRPIGLFILTFVVVFSTLATSFTVVFDSSLSVRTDSSSTALLLGAGVPD